MKISNKGIIGDALQTVETHIDLMTQEQLWTLTIDLAGLLFVARVRAAALQGIQVGSGIPEPARRRTVMSEDPVGLGYKAFREKVQEERIQRSLELLNARFGKKYGVDYELTLEEWKEILADAGLLP